MGDLRLQSSGTDTYSKFCAVANLFQFFQWYGREMLLIDNRTKWKREKNFSLCRTRGLSLFNYRKWLSSAIRLFWLSTMYVLRTVLASVGPCRILVRKWITYGASKILREHVDVGNPAVVFLVSKLAMSEYDWKKQGKIEKMIWNVNFVSSYRPRFAKFDSWSLVNKSTVCSNS